MAHGGRVGRNEHDQDETLTGRFGLETTVSLTLQTIEKRPGTKSGRRPTIKRVMHRLLNAGIVPSTVYIECYLFALAKTNPEEYFSIVWRVRGTFLFRPNRPVDRRPVSLVPAQSLRPAMRRPVSTSACYVRF